MRRPQPITRRTASTKHVLADALQKLLSRTGVSIFRSVTLSSTCCFTFTHWMILMLNAFHPNTHGEAVGAYVSRTSSLTSAFTLSSSRRLLRRTLWPPHSCMQRLRVPRERATEAKKKQVARSAIARPPAQSRSAECAAPEPQLLSAKGRGYRDLLTLSLCQSHLR